MKPPSVYELTRPSTHSTSMITAIVQSMQVTSPWREPGARPGRSSRRDELEEGLGGVAERARLGVEQAHLALDVQLLDGHLAQRAALDVLAHAHARQEGDALVALHQAADRLERRHLDVHVERHLVARNSRSTTSR